MHGGMGHGRGWRRLLRMHGPHGPYGSPGPIGPRVGPGPEGGAAARDWPPGEPEAPGHAGPGFGGMHRRPGAGGRFVEPFLLLLLAEGRSHGYDLMERLAERGFVRGEVDAGYLYRTLRGMEGAGLVTSEWDSASRGPIKRTYALTAAGEQALHRWAGALGEHFRALQRFLDAYAAHFPAGAAGGAAAAEAGPSEGGRMV